MKTNDYIERTFRIPIDLYHGAEKYSRDKGLSITAGTVHTLDGASPHSALYGRVCAGVGNIACNPARVVGFFF